MNKKIILYVTGILVFFTVIILACEKEKNTSAPELPPVSSFSITVSEFTSQKSTGTYANFLTAVVATGYWNTMLAAYMAVPVASYAEAFDHPAQRLDNNTWEWSYQVAVHDTTYYANLFAFVENDSIHVEMHISRDGGFQDFVWYTGTFDVLRTGGYWSIQDNPESNTNWLNIRWNHDYENETFDIQYTNVYPAGEYRDSYIKYGIRKDNPFDAFYNIYSSPDDRNYNIDYNTTTHEGRIYFESLWHCWDANFQDAVCE